MLLPPTYFYLAYFTRDLATATCYQAFANLAMGKTNLNNDRSSLKDLKERQKGRKKERDGPQFFCNLSHDITVAAFHRWVGASCFFRPDHPNLREPFMMPEALQNRDRSVRAIVAGTAALCKSSGCSTSHHAQNPKAPLRIRQ